MSLGRLFMVPPLSPPSVNVIKFSSHIQSTHAVYIQQTRSDEHSHKTQQRQQDTRCHFSRCCSCGDRTQRRRGHRHRVVQGSCGRDNPVVDPRHRHLDGDGESDHTRPVFPTRSTALRDDRLRYSWRTGRAYRDGGAICECHKLCWVGAAHSGIGDCRGDRLHQSGGDPISRAEK